jgi:predicted HAD superfamily Cof-like phosphohydrolase
MQDAGYMMVNEFHTVFGHPINDAPMMHDEKLKQFRLGLINEEIGELGDAIQKEDAVECLDALCDLAYVTYGAAIALGLSPNSVRLYAHEEYLRGDVEDIKFIDKDPSFYPFNVGYNGFRMYAQHLSNAKEGREFYDRLCHIIILIRNVCSDIGVNYEDAFAEVHRSNMSKVCADEESAQKSVEMYKEEGRYKYPAYRQSGDYYVVYDKETTKILKNHAWSVPNLKPFINLIKPSVLSKDTDELSDSCIEWRECVEVL